MRDKEHAEKRKREGQQGGAEGSPPRRDSRFTNDSDPASAEATPRKSPSPIATRMVTRSVEKGGRDTNHQSKGSSAPSGNGGSDTPREITMNDIMQQLLDVQRRAQEKEKREHKEGKREQEREKRKQEREEKQQEKGERYREEIRQLQTTVTTLVLDIDSLQEAAPNWGSLQSSSLQTGTTDSYASVAAQEIRLSSQEAVRTPYRSPTTKQERLRMSKLRPCVFLRTKSERIRQNYFTML